MSYQGTVLTLNNELVVWDVHLWDDKYVEIHVLSFLRFTQIAMDSVCVVRSIDISQCVNQDIIFLGTGKT